MSPDEPNHAEAPSPSWRPHLGLCLVASIIVIAWLSLRRSDAQLLTTATDPLADARDRCSAIHMLAARPSADAARLSSLRELALSSEHHSLQVLAAGSDLQRDGAFERMGPPASARPAMEQHLASRFPLDAQDWLWFVAYRRKVGGMQVGSRRRLDTQETAWTLAALAGESIPSKLVRQHIVRRIQNSISRPR